MAHGDEPKETDSGDLLRQVREGDDQAVQELLDRFLHRLIGLARKNLPTKLNRRVDADDVVQSALRSFFVHARQGDFGVDGSGQLWRLLAAITVNKVRYQIRRNTAGKRSVNDEASVSETSSVFALEPEALANDPSVDHKLALEEQIARIMSDRTPVQRQIILLLLKGHSDKEIASEAKCTLRTVQRTKKSFKEQLEQDLQATTSWRRTGRNCGSKAGPNG